jgi:hypothetical protein
MKKEGKRPILSDLLKERFKDLRNSKLPNPLSANMSVILISSQLLLLEIG